MTPREELEALRRLAELEAKAGNAPPAGAQGVDGSSLFRADMLKLLDPIMGAIRGAGSIGATLLAPNDALNAFLLKQPMTDRRAAMDEALRGLGARPDSVPFQVGKLGAEIAGSAGVGNVLGGLAGAAGAAPKVVEALSTYGMRTGAAPATLGARAADLGLRTAAGGAAGYAAAGLVNPEDALTGGAVGAAMPGAMKAAGTAGNAIGRAFRGPEQTPELAESVLAARNAGYVIPPTQAKPSLLNRVIEGAAGKITTAQNASARNAPVTKELARRAIGAADLTPSGIQAVRDAANQGYDNLAAVGSFSVDDVFRKAIETAQPKTIPGTKNADVSLLIDNLKMQQVFDAQETINTLKQLRFEGFANKALQDPTKKALGFAQITIAKELENLIERNLSAAGQTGLLQAFRDSRKLLAKVHTVEKALNTASGSVDARVLAKELTNGKPLEGDLLTAANFAKQFPKAAQTVEQMGSLPQWSPLDLFGSSMLGGAAALASGNLGGAATGLLFPAARVGARSAALSPLVQNNLIQSQGGLLSDPTLDLLYRSAPLLAGDR